ncbi:MAG: rhodanese-like domain-containing protein [Gammaproteobacteria bacterium]|nr:rhodanese-like domain-containing protein [Gammaproteobacteria bacterium]
MSYRSISVQEFSEQLQNQAVPLCIDVRNEDEFAGRRCRGSVNVPLPGIDAGKVQKLIDDAGLGADQTVYLICMAGMRSQRAAEILAGKLTNPVCFVNGGGVDDLHPDHHE